MLTLEESQRVMEG
jgi:hypothetical protein